MLSPFEFLFKRPFVKGVQQSLRYHRHIYRNIFPQFHQSISTEPVLFPNLPRNFRKTAITTFEAVRMLDKNTIEELSTNATLSVKECNQKRELTELADILSRSPNLANSAFQDNPSISEYQKRELKASKTPLDVIKNYLQVLNEKRKSRRIRIEPFQFHPLSYNLSGLYSATIKTEATPCATRMIFTVNQEGIPEFFAILPSHEYELLTSIFIKAEDLQEVQVLFEKYNVYWFNQDFSAEDQYKNFLRKCNRLKFSKAIIDYLELKKTQITNHLEKSKLKSK